MNQALIDGMVQASVAHLVRAIRERMSSIVGLASEKQNADALLDVLATTVTVTIEEVASYGETDIQRRNEICRYVLAEVARRLQHVADKRWTA